MAELLTQTEFSRRVGVSRQRVTQLVQAGRLPTVAAGRRGQLKVPWSEGKAIWDTDHALHTGQPMEAEPAQPIAAPDDPDAEPQRRGMTASLAAAVHAQGRAKLVSYQADIKRLQRDRLRETLIEKAAVDADAENVALLIRGALQGLPSKLAPRLEGRTTPEIESVLAEEIDQALLALHESRYLP